jgi:hypothetical protein
MMPYDIRLHLTAPRSRSVCAELPVIEYAAGT